MKVLFACSEIWPLLKTGGLADVAYSLPRALNALPDMQVQIVLPAYREILRQCRHTEILAWMDSPYGQQPALRLIQAEHPSFDKPLWLIDSQPLFDRPGNPYLAENGQDWPDNAERYAQFAWAVAEIAMGDVVDWHADVVHSNDWQCGLTPAFLDQCADRPRRIFTIHNLAYGGHFSREQFEQLGLPGSWWNPDGTEFYGGFSMLKAGLVYSDAINTVSPRYAEEICTTEFGYGMEGVLSSRRYKLSGILNGVDTEIWNPQTDELLPARYTSKRLQPGKRRNKQALLSEFIDGVDDAILDAPLFGSVGRLVEQKGIDLIVQAIPNLIANSNANFLLMGSGNAWYERVIRQLCDDYPDRVFCYIGYSEQMAHRLEAGCDIFLMPSRFEPCGLNQMYSLQYGTPPLVTNTGGLADTVVDTDPNTLANDTANGFVMSAPTLNSLITTMQRSLECFSNKKLWRKLQKNGMNANFDWQQSAKQYTDLYQSLKQETPHHGQRKKQESAV